ncbi:type II secretion system protein [Tistrella mobilis]|nr:prepilin-type N-terminal cleavage/methylation domain-containing protein [Tistrella mobilis]
MSIRTRSAASHPDPKHYGPTHSGPRHSGPRHPAAGPDITEDDRGFTLVEVAIALVVIALLVGTVLQAQGMVGNSRAQAFVSEVGAIRTAFGQFQERYGALPGDYTDAAALASGVTAGDGNGILSGDGASQESLNAWRHLTAAQFLTNLKMPPAGTSAPSTPLGGQYQLVSATVGATSGVWLRIGSMTTGSTTGNSTPLLTVDQARRLDMELDDGLPATGSVVTSTAACQVTGSNMYNLAATDTCLIQVLM